MDWWKSTRDFPHREEYLQELTFRQKTSQWKALSCPDRIMPAVSIIHNRAVLYTKPQLSTRMQILKIAFERATRDLNKNTFRMLLSIVRDFLYLKSGTSKINYFLINFFSENNIIVAFVFSILGQFRKCEWGKFTEFNNLSILSANINFIFQNERY